MNLALKKGYTLLSNDLGSAYVLPWSIDEAWANLFEDAAPYSFDRAFDDIGHVLI